MKLASLLPVVVGALLLAVPASAQSAVPNGAFVRDGDGTVWLVQGGQRLQVPIYPATADDIAAIPASDQWAVPSPDGNVTAGARPDWAMPSQVTTPPATQPTPPPPGRTATYDALTVTVLNVDRGWKSDNQFTKPKAGNEFVTIEIRLDNAGPQPITYNAYDFKAVTADGGRWNFTISRKPEISSGQVLVGTPVRGWLTFEIPTGNPVTQLLWSPRFDTTLAISL